MPTPQAYRLLAKRHHPDKGGDPAAFARLQAAFEVLSDPRKRGVYDTWAKELQFRCVLCSGWVSSHVRAGMRRVGGFAGI